MKTKVLKQFMIIHCLIFSAGVAAISAQEIRNPFIPQLPTEEEEEPEPVDVAPTNPRPVVVERRRPQPQPRPTKEPEPVRPPSVKISGLIWNSDRPQAIIDGDVYDVGDTIKGMKILSIDKTGINVEYQGKKFTINAKKE